jgi:hypothetical protein
MASKRKRVKLDAATLRWVARWLARDHGWAQTRRLARELRLRAAQEARRG